MFEKNSASLIDHDYVREINKASVPHKQEINIIKDYIDGAEPIITALRKAKWKCVDIKPDEDFETGNVTNMFFRSTLDPSLRLQYSITQKFKSKQAYDIIKALDNMEDEENPKDIEIPEGTDLTYNIYHRMTINNTSTFHLIEDFISISCAAMDLITTGDLDALPDFTIRFMKDKLSLQYAVYDINAADFGMEEWEY